MNEKLKEDFEQSERGREREKKRKITTWTNTFKKPKSVYVQMHMRCDVVQRETRRVFKNCMQYYADSSNAYMFVCVCIAGESYLNI